MWGYKDLLRVREVVYYRLKVLSYRWDRDSVWREEREAKPPLK